MSLRSQARLKRAKRLKYLYGRSKKFKFGEAKSLTPDPVTPEQKAAALRIREIALSKQNKPKFTILMPWSLLRLRPKNPWS